MQFNRCAVTTTAKQPFKDWLDSLPDMLDLSLTGINNDNQVFLLPYFSSYDETEGLLREFFEEIFEKWLAGYWTNPVHWPADRSLKVFHEWFDVKFHSMITDLVDDEPLAWE